MRIGQFVERLNATKDTIRHYEELELIKPKWVEGKRVYCKQNEADFYAIKEMQGLGLSLKEIQVVFKMKDRAGCGSEDLLKKVNASLTKSLLKIEKEELELKQKKVQIYQLMNGIDLYLN